MTQLKLVFSKLLDNAWAVVAIVIAGLALLFKIESDKNASLKVQLGDAEVKGKADVLSAKEADKGAQLVDVNTQLAALPTASPASDDPETAKHCRDS